HFVYCVFFFLSSRRRHTSSQRDWSSDVCSSDLQFTGLFVAAVLGIGLNLILPQHDNAGIFSIFQRKKNVNNELKLKKDKKVKDRSEERRVGKECRCERLWTH